MLTELPPTSSTSEFRKITRGLRENSSVSEKMKRRALFLDRDGVVNVDHGYVKSSVEFQFISGIFELCRAAQTSGFLLVVITNQAGIAHGYYSGQAVDLLHRWMCDRFAENGITVDAIYYCPFHPAAAVKKFQADSFDRKPNPGMLLRAAEDLNVDLADSVLVGDRDTDIEAGVRGGVGKLFKFD